MRLPHRRRPPAERVVLDVSGLRPLAASVLRTVDGAAELLLDEPQARGLHRCDAVLRSAESHGATPLPAVLVAVQDDRGRLREDVVHAVWTSASQRRAFVRVPAFRPVTVVPRRDGRALRAVTRDLGAGGALLGGSAAAQLRTGERLRLSLELTDDDVLRADARVLRADPDDAVAAVALDALTEADREHLVRWVRAREIDARIRLRPA